MPSQARVALFSVVVRQFAPVPAGSPVPVPFEPAILEGHFRHQSFGSVVARTEAIHVAEVTGLFLEHRDVRRRADRQVSDVFASDSEGRLPGGLCDHILQGLPERQELAHGRDLIVHAGVHGADVEVCRNRVRREAGLETARRHAPTEAAAAVRHIEEHASFAAREEAGIRRAVREQLAPVPRVAVAVDVSPAEPLTEEGLERAFRVIVSEVHHQGKARRLAGPKRFVHRKPVRGGVVGGLDPDDDIGVIARESRSRRGLHVTPVLLDLSAPHPVADDVHERQYARPGAADDGLPEDLEVPPAGAPGVEHGGNARAEGMAVRIEAAVAYERSRFVGARERVHVHIEKPGRDVEPLRTPRP